MSAVQNDILLTNGSAAALFQKTARDGYAARADRAFLRALVENRPYQTPTELWIEDCSYAKAFLRLAGAEETFVEGAGADFEKFRLFCTVMGDSVANPLKLQCHMALREVFDCALVLNETNCEKIWKTVCERLMQENFTPREYVKRCGVDRLLVPVSPWESLEDFVRIPDLRVLPVFAPDAYFLPSGKDFAAAVHALDTEICDFKSFCKALSASLDRFAASGCRVATQSVLPIEFCRPNEYHADLYFKKALAGEALAPKELALYQAQLWRVLSEAYVKRDMTLELCVGETVEKTRTVSGDFPVKTARELLDYLKERVGLPRVAVYVAQSVLIPTLAALAGCYPASGEGEPQLALGIWQTNPAETRAQLRALASAMPLSACVGALPDARLPQSPFCGVLFHRTLCAELADWEAHGETDAGEENLARIVTHLTGGNMRKYYKL